LEEFQTYDYPLDECLKICKANPKLREATAFLLERSGALNDALNIYLEVFGFICLKNHIFIYLDFQRTYFQSSKKNRKIKNLR
jgi:hypothetical protein